MSRISETHTSLRFSGDDLNPTELTALLGGAPSTCASKGDVIRGERTAQTGSWIARAERREPGDLDAQIEEILLPLSKDLSIWRSLGRYRPNLFVSLFLQETNEGIEISPHCLCLLAERGIRLGLDIYGARSEWRNIQVIDSADNATFSVFQATEDEFCQIFPPGDRDMEISEDFVQRVGEAHANLVLNAIWQRPVLKRDVHGIHGTLYFNYQSRRQHMPTSKREVDLNESSINAAQRMLFAKHR
ncbi:hypothetical protein SSBR45G_01600 [Bradyrhizobium sp. SSBR45G]|uniref:DUF4279 domain-containing protein n=1 Tax=unclassified Bradyrhizobium TaxID=2631580 RepID=UPI0023428D44|nr:MULTISPECIES: DUF4279 domain-containing protein [unclassified Bradyrhizobium]GLH75252.1 hypothetical protein SSBR45G_01600 [Bradyrhizobium sp. SSBR45G]GLH82961.1 hypothetical protein SSBR45R_04210 [Bradyrhizobium sp. SSBR45R]